MNHELVALPIGVDRHRRWAETGSESLLGEAIELQERIGAHQHLRILLVVCVLLSISLYLIKNDSGILLSKGGWSRIFQVIVSVVTLRRA